MYIVKNAYKSIVRAKGRNLLIFILVFLIAVSACVALSVRNSAEAAKETAYNSLSITAQISTNRQNIMGGGGFDRDSMMNKLSQSLTLDEMNYYAKSEFVDNFYYSMSAGLNAPEDFSIYETSSSGGFGGGFGGMMGGGHGGMQGGMMPGQGGFGGQQGGRGEFNMDRAQGGNYADAQSSATVDSQSSATVDSQSSATV